MCWPAGTRASIWQALLLTTVFPSMLWLTNEDLAWVTMPSMSMNGKYWNSCKMCWRWASCYNVVTTRHLTNQYLRSSRMQHYFSPMEPQTLPWLSQPWTTSTRCSQLACSTNNNLIQPFNLPSDTPRTHSTSTICLQIHQRFIASWWVSNLFGVIFLLLTIGFSVASSLQARVFQTSQMASRLDQHCPWSHSCNLRLVLCSTSCSRGHCIRKKPLGNIVLHSLCSTGSLRDMYSV